MQNMNSFFRDEINRGGFELVDMIERLTTVYASGGLTTEQLEQLKALAFENADPAASLAPIEYRFNVIIEKVAALEARVDALEAGQTGGTSEPGGDEPGTDEPTAPPIWLQPLGAHDAYNTGDRVTFEGKVYESTIDGNVWSPAAYPAGWTEITVDTEPETSEEE